MSRVVSDRNIVRIYAGVWVVSYLIVYFFLKGFLPEEYFRDSLMIQKLAVTGDTQDWGGAYQIAAYMVRVLSVPVTTAMVAVMGTLTIWYVASSVQNMRGMFIMVPVLLPFIILNMMDFGKESFVIPLTFLVLFATKKARSTQHAILSIIVIYFLYGALFRAYYLIILMIFIGLVVMRRGSNPIRGLYLLISVVLISLLPGKLFESLQGDRDRINRIANLYFTHVHTAIFNPLKPDSALHFLINYAYVVIRLNLPFLFRQSSNEFILTFDIILYGRLIYIGLKKLHGPVTLLPLLYLSHIIVLMIFEPDAGSYLRHGSSVLIYLVPALQLLEQKRAEYFFSLEKRKERETSSFIAAGTNDRDRLL